MKLIIDIPEEEFNECKMQVDMIKQEGFLVESPNTALKIHVANGTPLPKGHGDLIDADSLIKAIEEKAKRLSNADVINGLCGAVALIFDEQTIIEADNVESEDKE